MSKFNFSTVILVAGVAASMVLGTMSLIQQSAEAGVASAETAWHTSLATANLRMLAHVSQGFDPMSP
jgi:hypothetical protein